MSRRPNGAKSRRQTSLRVWSLAQAEAAVPYITSIVRSLREHALEALTQRRRVLALEARPGRPDRAALIERQEAQRDCDAAEQAARDAADELASLDVLCLDAIRGQAAYPFVHDEQLAWYVFDLFDTPQLRFWRFQSDPADTRRPITAQQHGVPAGARA
jgi:hypothetical protein